MNTLILDVRTPEEYATGHLKDAILVPTEKPPGVNQALLRRYLELLVAGRPKVTPIVTYCLRGHRSALATTILYQMGYWNTVDIGGTEAGPLSERLAAGKDQLVT